MRCAMQVTHGGDLIAEGRIIAAPITEAMQQAAGGLEGGDARAEPPDQDKAPADGEAPGEPAAPTLVSSCCMWIRTSLHSHQHMGSCKPATGRAAGGCMHEPARRQGCASQTSPWHAL
jgi:hypothetical protein